MTERAMDAETKDFEKYHRAHIFVSLLIWQLDDAMDCELEVVLERIKYHLKQFQALF